MSRPIASMLTIVAIATAMPLHGQAASPDLESFAKSLPGKLIDDPTRQDWQVYGPGVLVKPIRSADIPGGHAAVQLTIPKQGANPYETSANVPLTATVRTGEQVVMSFYARTISAATPDGQGLVTVRFQQNAAPYPGFGDKKVAIGKEWKFYEVPAVATTDLANGLGIGMLQLAGAAQVLQIGQVIVLSGASSAISTTQTSRTIAAPVPPIIPPQLQDKGTLLNDPASRSWSSHGFAAEPQPITVGIPGGSATRFVADKSANAWDASAGVPIAHALATGDPLIVAFIARTISAETPDGKAVLGLRIQQNEAPYNGFGDHVIAIGPNWGLVQLRTVAKMPLGPGKGEVTLQLGGAKQTVEVGPVYVLKADAPAVTEPRR